MTVVLLVALVAVAAWLLSRRSSSRASSPLVESVPEEPTSFYDRVEKYAYEADSSPLTRKLIERFGGHGFLFNLRMWAAAVRDGPCCRHVPPDDHYRKRFEVLASTGVATRGLAIPLETRFQALPMSALREAAKALGAGPMRKKMDGAKLVASRPEADAWFSTRFVADDFFMLQPERWSYADLEAQWRTYTTRIEREGHEGYDGGNDQE